MRSLTAKGLEMHGEYARSGMDTGFQHRGCVSVYETEAGFSFGRREAEHENTAAFSSRVLDHAELRELGIELGPHAVGAVFFGEDAHCDSYRFVSAVGAAAASAGAVLRTGVEVRRLLRSGRQVVGVETSAGTLHPREVVLAAGAWSGHLARQIGVFLPIEGGKGYHVDLAAAPSDPHVPVYLHESKVIATPLDGRLRIAGTLELAGLDMSINSARLATVRRSAERAMNGVAGRKSVETWSGLRPCTPDGLPVIGRPRVLDNVVIATGHAMKGVALGPITGRLVAELASGAQPSFDLRPLRGERFLSLLQSANPE
jgi:D-amino-acid dehydrogenase